MSKPAKVLRIVILLLISVGGLSFAVLAVLAATGPADPRFAAAAFGVALLAAGANEIADVLVADWMSVALPPPPGDRSPGRLSSFGAGLVLVSVGGLMIGLDRVPLAIRWAAVAVIVLGFAFILVGQSVDRRHHVLAD
jgi:hypothetical protein